MSDIVLGFSKDKNYTQIENENNPINFKLEFFFKIN